MEDVCFIIWSIGNAAPPLVLSLQNEVLKSALVDPVNAVQHRQRSQDPPIRNADVYYTIVRVYIVKPAEQPKYGVCIRHQNMLLLTTSSKHPGAFPVDHSAHRLKFVVLPTSVPACQYPQNL